MPDQAVDGIALMYMIAYPDDACMDGAGDDAAVITAVLGDIARGMAELAQKTGLTRGGLVKRQPELQL